MDFQTEVVPGMGDHNIVVCELKAKTLSDLKKKRSLYIYNAAKWGEMKLALSRQFDVFHTSSSNNNSEANWIYITSLLLELMKQYIPSKQYPLVNKFPWVNRRLRNMLN
jgi:hypothetical protein